MFLWGAGVATFSTIIINEIGKLIVALTFGNAAAKIYGLSIAAPVVEELTKAGALLVVFLWKRKEIDGVVDAVVYASMVGLGFSTVENFIYYGATYLHDQAVIVTPLT